MDASTNPLTVLSYVSGPALLTNATSLLLLSTSNRFARAIDRSRYLVIALESQSGSRSKYAVAEELVGAQKRVRLIGQAMAAFYLATGMFTLATMIAIAGAVVGQVRMGVTFDAVISFAALSGVVGFSALVLGATALMRESRLAVRSLKAEAAEAIDAIDRALHPQA